MRFVYIIQLYKKYFVNLQKNIYIHYMKRFVILFLLMIIVSCGEATGDFKLSIAEHYAKKDFYVLDFSSSESLYQYRISAKLISAGNHCLVYLHENEINTYKTIYSIGQNIADTFDKKIYPTLTSVFNKPSDSDNNDKVIILLYDIKDGFSKSNTAFIGGYFYPPDIIDSSITYKNGYGRSNEAEIFYMDINPQNPNSDDFLETLAHEFLHMIIFNSKVMKNPKSDTEDMEKIMSLYEETWLNEGLAELATDIVFGEYRKDRVDYFSNVDDIPLTWKTLRELSSTLISPNIINGIDSVSKQMIEADSALKGYSIAYMYVRYLADLGLKQSNDYSFLNYFTDTTLLGIENVEHYLEKVSYIKPKTFEESYKYWLSALSIRQRSDWNENLSHEYKSIPKSDKIEIYSNSDTNASSIGIRQSSFKHYLADDSNVKTIEYKDSQSNDKAGMMIFDDNILKSDPPYRFYDESVNYELNNLGADIFLINFNTTNENYNVCDIKIAFDINRLSKTLSSYDSTNNNDIIDIDLDKINLKNIAFKDRKLKSFSIVRYLIENKGIIVDK